METATPIEELAQITTRWQDTMLSLEKVYEQEPEVLSIGGVAIRDIGKFQCIHWQGKKQKDLQRVGYGGSSFVRKGSP